MSVGGAVGVGVDGDADVVVDFDIGFDVDVVFEMIADGVGTVVSIGMVVMLMLS